MATSSSLTRSLSTDSSALSNILVASAAEMDDSSERVSASTPPTSLAESNSAGSAKSEDKTLGLDKVVEDTTEVNGGNRPKRTRSRVSTYNLKKLSDAQQAEAGRSSRNVSGLTGETLVHRDEQDEEGASFGANVDKAMDMDWEIPTGSTSLRTSPRRPVQRRPSVKDKVKKVAGTVGSVLGKRGRDVFEAGKRTLGLKEKQDEDVKQSKLLKELDMGTKGVLDEMDLDEDFQAPTAPRPTQKARLSGTAPLQDIAQGSSSAAAPVQKSSNTGRRMKKWQKEGLFVGQDVHLDLSQDGGRKKLQKKSQQRPDSSASDATLTGKVAKRPSFMSLPMFNYLDQTRDFIVPYDVFNPSWKKGDEKPKDWSQLNRNRLVGEAKELWERAENLPASSCVCTPPTRPGEHGCDEVCLNRVMQYECNDSNCNLDASVCSNRAFAELSTRMKKGGAYDVGVEVIKTANRGFGVRSCRTFAPGQIIMEYTGEIISEGECQRRMREEYIDKECYYLMELERGLIIDGTRGSMARFINHSCEPNCEVRMVKVNGTPRMGVFAGEAGICTGEELSYDYNFDNFGKSKQICRCGAPTCRGFLSKRLKAAEMKKAVKEEMERKRKAMEESQRNAENEERRKKVKNDRGSSWRGWVAVDDPETKERLKREKRDREEAEKNSVRARRLAARRHTLPVEKEMGMKKKNSARRKTMVPTKAVEQDAEPGAAAGAKENKDDDHSKSAEKIVSSETHTRITSRGSKFKEQLESDNERPATPQITNTTIKKTTEVSVTQTTHGATTQMTFEVAKTKETAEDGMERKKNLLKFVGQAVKNGLVGNGSGGGKLRQSTLNFGRIA